MSSIAKASFNWIRVFRFNSESIHRAGLLDRLRGKEKPFEFLVDRDQYYSRVLKEPWSLTDRNTFIPGLGQLRSAVCKKHRIPDGTLEPDELLNNIREYYVRQPPLMPSLCHYPCVIDVYPSKNRVLEMDIKSLPGTLRSASKVRMSCSIHLFPIGLVSIRVGAWLEQFQEEMEAGKKGFSARDVTPFMRQRRAEVYIRQRKAPRRKASRHDKMTVQELFRTLKSRFMKGIGEESSIGPWVGNPYHIIDIWGVTGPQWINDELVALLELNVRESPAADRSTVPRKPTNVYFGKNSIVLYSEGLDIDALSSVDGLYRRKIRRVYRNLIDLFVAQRTIADRLHDLNMDEFSKELLASTWMGTIKQGVWPTNVKEVLKSLDLLMLHERKEVFRGYRSRYLELLKELDKDRSVTKAQDTAKELSKRILKRVAESRDRMESALKSVFETIERLAELK